MAQTLTSPDVARAPTAPPSQPSTPRRVRPINVNKGLLLLRVVVGLLFIGHGCQKLFGWFGGPGLGGWMDSLAKSGLQPAPLWAFTAAFAELGGGVLLLLGLLTPIAAALLIGDMLVAIADVHASKGLWSQNGGFEYNLVLIALLVSIGLIGPGIYSLDRRLPAWPRVRIFALALCATLVVVAVALLPQHTPGG